jgi:hypothetical protein
VAELDVSQSKIKHILMKRSLLLAILTTITLYPALAVTADDLAKYLGVSTLSTTVTLPSESFIVEIYKISNGAIGDRIFEGIPAWSKSPEKGLQIMYSQENGKYRIGILYGSGNTLTVTSDVPAFDSTLSPNLPDTIKAGDYVLFGKPKRDGSIPVAEKISSYSDGFLLRIKENG